MKKPLTVLFLEDEGSILHCLERLFGPEEFGIMTTTDHRTALDVISKEEIKVVVSDHRMPNIRGTDFLKQVRDASPSTVRILFSGYTDFRSAEEAINISGVYRFITKPWDNDEMIAIIHQAIAQYDADKRKEDELQSLRRRVRELEEKLRCQG
ncbi:MAG: response regulator [Candidatus Omnitrophica bacterium]|nr:response regulator [Candidatus Omnitrophota bacterium]